MQRLLCLALGLAAAAGWAQPLGPAQPQASTQAEPAAPAAADAPVPAEPLQSVPVAPVVVPADLSTVSQPAPRPETKWGQPAAASGPAIPAAVAPAAPAPLIPNGRWDGDVQAGFSLSEGSSPSLSLQLGLDASYERPEDKLSLLGQYLETRSRSLVNGVPITSVTALRWRAAARYDRNFDGRDFGFAGLDFSHDQAQLLRLRSEPSLGLGRHLLRTRDDQWDVYAGLSYREDYYDDPGVEIQGQLRTRYDSVDTLFGQESAHQLAQQLRLKQKFVLYPGLLSTQGTRALADAGLQLDINRSLSLSVKLQLRYDAWAPAEKMDLLLLTGLSVKLGS
jgi:putative salt-induced outer membrane protein YdiY